MQFNFVIIIFGMYYFYYNVKVECIIILTIFTGNFIGFLGLIFLHLYSIDYYILWYKYYELYTYNTIS